jgi:hypothetical protein
MLSAIEFSSFGWVPESARFGDYTGCRAMRNITMT